MSAVWLFVYGSLRRDADGGQHPLLAAATFAGPATVAGTLYRVDWYPGLVPGSEGTVHGEVFELPRERADQILMALDDYEGGGFRRRKVVASVHGSTSGGSTSCDAWAYTYIGPVHALERIASGDYGVPVHRAHP